jgi:hypothetical protein
MGNLRARQVESGALETSPLVTKGPGGWLNIEKIEKDYLRIWRKVFEIYGVLTTGLMNGSEIRSAE